MPTHIRLPFKVGFVEDSTVSRKSRGTLLSAIDVALDKYVHNNSKVQLLKLTDALAAWKRSKGAYSAWQKNSIRSDAVIKLSDWLIKESKAIGIFPTSRPFWGSNHNCYAYAMLCKKPELLGQNSRPGKHAGRTASLQADFVQGVIEDARFDGKDVLIPVNGADKIPAPIVNDGNYLVAMISSKMGYHFLRRRESTGLWGHKPNGMSDVETYFYDFKEEKPVAMTDALMSKLLTNPLLLGFGNMKFHSFFRVPKSGVQVKG